MWDLLDLALFVDNVRENAIVYQLLCMLAIVVVIVACGYMAFVQGQYIWLGGGGVVIVLLGLTAVWLGRLDP